jgi:hypothetical protein
VLHAVHGEHEIAREQGGELLPFVRAVVSRARLSAAGRADSGD